MDLFVMKRYMGGDGNEQQRQDNHLSSLLTKIDKRKKEREKLQLTEVGLASFEHKPKEYNEIKAKKRKDDLGDSSSPSDKSRVSEGQGEITDPVEPHCKEKKRRRKDPHNELKPNLCGTNDVLYDTKGSETSKEILSDTNRNEVTSIISSIANENETEISGFTVIGTDDFKKKKKVQRVLPLWLANPSVVSVNLKEQTKSVDDIPDLHPELVKKLKQDQIEYFFPVQYEVIPWLLKAYRRPLQYRPNDVCVSSPTGSGKTLAYVLPIIQALKSQVMKNIRALIVLPVQELARQIYLVFKKYSAGTGLNIMLFNGEETVATEQSKLVMTNIIVGQYNPVDIIVTTPGRLVHHIKHTPGFSLKYLRFLVIDEADIVVEHILNDWLYHVEKHIYGEIKGGPPPLNISTLHSFESPPFQKLLFSATLTQNPEKLEQLKLFQPKLFATIMEEHTDHNLENQIGDNFIGKYATPAELTENYCVIDFSFKPLAIYLLLTENNWKSVLCFTNSKESTHRLFLLLKYLCQGTLEIGQLSGNLRHATRNRVLKKFSSGSINVLICSDSLARGIDIPTVDCVISYDAPKYIETYVHRTGRTARAGNLGTAITVLTTEEEDKFKTMLNVAGKQNKLVSISLSESLLESKEEQYREALIFLRNELEKQEAHQKLKTKLKTKQETRLKTRGRFQRKKK